MKDILQFDQVFSRSQIFVNFCIYYYFLGIFPIKSRPVPKMIKIMSLDFFCCTWTFPKSSRLNRPSIFWWVSSICCSPRVASSRVLRSTSTDLAGSGQQLVAAAWSPDSVWLGLVMQEPGNPGLAIAVYRPPQFSEPTQWAVLRLLFLSSVSLMICTPPPG